MKVSNPKIMSLWLFICIASAGLFLYAFIDKQNELTELRLAIPALSKDVKAIQDENVRLQYEVDRFESPIHLMELSRKPEFGHLRYPYIRDVLILAEKPPLAQPMEEK